MSDSYKLALEEAKKELRDIDKLISDLLPRKERLAGLVRILEPMVQRGVESRSSEPDETIDLFGRTEPLWKLIARAMRQTGEPFTLATAGVEVEKWTGQSLGVNRPQKVRNAIIRHPETFKKDEEEGTYTVISDV
jgi:hypothetical protein